jgi:hypothetical protein
MTDTPKCARSAGKIHDENPPAAVVEVVLEWDTRDGEPMRRIRNLCLACFLDKREEFMENARDDGHSLLTVHYRYEGAPAEVPAAGRRFGRADLSFQRRHALSRMTTTQ